MKLKNITAEYLMKCKEDMLNKGHTPDRIVLSSKVEEESTIGLCGHIKVIIPPYKVGRVGISIMGMEVYLDYEVEPNTMKLVDTTEEIPITKKTLLQKFKLWWMERFWLK